MHTFIRHFFFLLKKKKKNNQNDNRFKRIFRAIRNSRTFFFVLRILSLSTVSFHVSQINSHFAQFFRLVHFCLDAANCHRFHFLCCSRSCFTIENITFNGIWNFLNDFLYFKYSIGYRLADPMIRTADEHFLFYHIRILNNDRISFIFFYSLIKILFTKFQAMTISFREGKKKSWKIRSHKINTGNHMWWRKIVENHFASRMLCSHVSLLLFRTQFTI